MHTPCLMWLTRVCCPTHFAGHLRVDSGWLFALGHRHFVQASLPGKYRIKLWGWWEEESKMRRLSWRMNKVTVTGREEGGLKK